MINLAPINAKIRAELHRRQKMLNKESPPSYEPQTSDNSENKKNANNILSKAT
jgi:hypothetical protein